MTRKQPFEQVVAEHGATVLRVCRAVLGSLSDADDAWSETFLSAMRHYLSLPADANVEAWLVTIAHRKAIDLARARQRHAIPVSDIPERLPPHDTREPPDRDLWIAVKKLPERQRQAVAYHYLGGMPYREVSQIIGGTVEAARRAASDGIKQLRIYFRSGVSARPPEPVSVDKPAAETRHKAGHATGSTRKERTHGHRRPSD